MSTKAQRWQLLGLVVMATVALFAAAIALGAFKSKSSEVSVSKQGIRGVVETQKLLSGIKQSGMTLGDPKAPVTITVFADPSCSHCRDDFTGELRKVINELVRPGKAKMQVELIALDQFKPGSQRARTAVHSLAQGNQPLQFLQLIYYNQGAPNGSWVQEAGLRKIAGALAESARSGLSFTQNAKTETLDSAADKMAAKLGAKSTPTFFVGKTGAAKPKRIDKTLFDSTFNKIRDAVDDASR